MRPPKRKPAGKTALDQLEACASVCRIGTTKPRLTLPAKQTAAVTLWSATDKKIPQGIRARAKTAVEKQVLRNRTAASKGRHVVE